MGIRVLSLFDGMGCGLLALKRAGIAVSEYHAYEIDKYAIQVAKANHPEIIHHGEINFMTDFTQYAGFDLLIGGSPCQGFSAAGQSRSSPTYSGRCRSLNFLQVWIRALRLG